MGAEIDFSSCGYQQSKGPIPLVPVRAVVTASDRDDDRGPIQAAIDSATAALEAGNVDEAREALAALRGQRGDGDEDRPQRDRNGRDRQDRIRERVGEIRDRVADRVQDMRAGILQHMVERIQHAIDSGNLPAGADATAIQTGVATAAAALEAGDLDAAREALNSIRPNRGERPDAEGDMDDDGEPENDADGNDQDRDQGERRTRGGRPPRGRTPRG